MIVKWMNFFLLLAVDKIVTCFFGVTANTRYLLYGCWQWWFESYFHVYASCNGIQLAKTNSGKDNRIKQTEPCPLFSELFTTVVIPDSYSSQLLALATQQRSWLSLKFNSELVSLVLLSVAGENSHECVKAFAILLQLLALSASRLAKLSA